eukprot:160139-Pleurochrysis_carterae.AAC.2
MPHCCCRQARAARQGRGRKLGECERNAWRKSLHRVHSIRLRRCRAVAQSPTLAGNTLLRS